MRRFHSPHGQTSGPPLTRWRPAPSTSSAILFDLTERALDRRAGPLPGATMSLSPPALLSATTASVTSPLGSGPPRAAHGQSPRLCRRMLTGPRRHVTLDRMDVRILDPAQPTSSSSLGSHGQLDIFVPSHVETQIPGGPRYRPDGPAIALRWSRVPEAARLSQYVSLRASLLTRGGQTTPLVPDPPFTDTTLTSWRRDGAQMITRHPLSAPDGARHWDLDAAPTQAGRCPPGRAYVSDESYSFTDRDGTTIVFYDAPILSLNNPSESVRRGRYPTGVDRYELVALFFTALWLGRSRIGGVVWSYSWRYPLGLASLASSSYRRFDPPIVGDDWLASFHVRPPVGPTPAESRSKLFAWQDHGRLTCPSLELVRPGRTRP